MSWIRVAIAPASYAFRQIGTTSTVGAVAGVVAIPLVGYELPFPVLIFVLMTALFLLQYFEKSVSAPPGAIRRGGMGGLAAAGTLAALLTCGWAVEGRLRTGLSLWFGRAGVLGLDRDGNLIWDGLWHSRLAEASNIIGTNNWNIAALPVVSYTGLGIHDVCVIGLGTGITAAVAAKLGSVRKIDVYEINRGLEELHREYPEGTLHALDNPKIRIHWQDARAGLQIRDERYDLIATQPLYLRQAGSTFLNSREFLEIVRARLNPGGVFCLYSRGTRAQQLVMRETAASVFPYGESFMTGYLLVLSNSPFDLSAEGLERRFARYREDPLWREIAANAETSSPSEVRRLLDHPRLDWSAWGLNLTDDDPLIEYPGMIETRLRWAREAER